MSSNETPENLLCDPKTGYKLEPKEQPGYYPNYSSLGQRKYWDETTRQVVEKRVYEVPPIRFFQPEELPTMKAVCDRVIPQDDRLPERKIPVVHYIDQRLFENRSDGYRYEGMPPDQDVYRLGIQAVEQTAHSIHGVRFEELDSLLQDFILKSIHDGKKLAAGEIWDQMEVHHFWAMLVGDCVTAYYAHPWAWDEIGFGGPAYPRGYMRLEGGLPEPWEEDEKRYEWAAPPTSISDSYEPTPVTSSSSHPGQGGTH